MRKTKKWNMKLEEEKEAKIGQMMPSRPAGKPSGGGERPRRRHTWFFHRTAGLLGVSGSGREAFRDRAAAGLSKCRAEAPGRM